MKTEETRWEIEDTRLTPTNNRSRGKEIEEKLELARRIGADKVIIILRIEKNGTN